MANAPFNRPTKINAASGRPGRQPVQSGTSEVLVARRHRPVAVPRIQAIEQRAQQATPARGPGVSSAAADGLAQLAIGRDVAQVVETDGDQPGALGGADDRPGHAHQCHGGDQPQPQPNQDQRPTLHAELLTGDME